MPDDEREALPQTTPHPAPIFDTGPRTPLSGSALAVANCNRAMNTDIPKPGAAPPAPDRKHLLKWWKLVSVLLAVWLPAAGVGLALFSWWYSLVDKTPAVFVVLVYVVACIVAGLMLAMVPGRPLVSALAMAVMSAVFASAVAAAPLYGYYYCQVKSPCIAGIVPY